MIVLSRELWIAMWYWIAWCGIRVLVMNTGFGDVMKTVSDLVG